MSTEAAFDRVTEQTVAQVKKQEPGTVVYACHRVAEQEGSRVFYEMYRDEQAFEDHERQDHTRRFLTEREQHLACPPRVELLSLQLASGVPVVDGD